MPDRVESPFPNYSGSSLPSRDQPSPFPAYSSNETRLLPVEYPPDVTEYPSIICYIRQNFEGAFLNVNATDFLDLWVDTHKLELTSTCDFFHWLLNKPPNFYSSFYPGQWHCFRDIVIETRIIVDFMAEWSRLQNQQHDPIVMYWDDYMHYKDTVYDAVCAMYPLSRVVTTNGMAGYYQFMGVSPVLTLMQYWV